MEKKVAIPFSRVDHFSSRCLSRLLAKPCMYVRMHVELFITEKRLHNLYCLADCQVLFHI